MALPTTNLDSYLWVRQLSGGNGDGAHVDLSNTTINGVALWHSAQRPWLIRASMATAARSGSFS